MTPTAIKNLQDDINVCTKFEGNPSNSCQGISIKTTNINLIAALDEKCQRIIKFNMTHPVGSVNTCAKFPVNHITHILV